MALSGVDCALVLLLVPLLMGLNLSNTLEDIVGYATKQPETESLTLNLLVLFADNLCKQFGPRSGVKPGLDPNCLTL